MNDWRTILTLVFVLHLFVAYMIEVCLGSRPGFYNAELGIEVGCGKRTRLSNKEFFFRYVPIMLGVASFLLLVARCKYIR